MAAIYSDVVTNIRYKRITKNDLESVNRFKVNNKIALVMIDEVELSFSIVEEINRTKVMYTEVVGNAKGIRKRVKDVLRELGVVFAEGVKSKNVYR